MNRRRNFDGEDGKKKRYDSGKKTGNPIKKERHEGNSNPSRPSYHKPTGKFGTPRGGNTNREETDKIKSERRPTRNGQSRRQTENDVRPSEFRSKEKFDTGKRGDKPTFRKSSSGDNNFEKPYSSLRKKSYDKEDKGKSNRSSFNDKSKSTYRKSTYGNSSSGSGNKRYGRSQEYKSSPISDPENKRPYDDEAKGKKAPFRKPSGNRGKERTDLEKPGFQKERRDQARPRRVVVRRSKEVNPNKADIESTGHTHTKSPGEIRLNRFIANAGICSRRDADLLIKAGEITVNGKVVTEMGHKVNPGDEVRYNNRRLKREKMVYLLLNKPKDFITTTDDPDNRKTIMQLVAEAGDERIYPVGRLDRNTTGLILLTNDGELADKLSHPSNNIKKLYQVDLDKPIAEEDFFKIQEGVKLEDGVAEVDEVAIVSQDKKSLGLQIHSGKNRIVRRIFEHLGYEVVKLDRVMYAGLDKKDLPRGNWRHLTEKELIRLKFMK